jgi:hypothetical protein
MKIAKKDKYSVGQLSKASGVRVRTLHFFSENSLKQNDEEFIKLQ